ncbi:DUF2250 domain-containing protein [Desulforamulus aquiferis]|uniref:DUF2250 domain-containing protein n=1 Tax=Desulforamulus aquiferis TaxID=1397668 RepID=A0AAW7ZJL0_9FIRM|nr:DUF2250 domain-containing protein [Desulforamulus aquiferis]MDO7789148.1 DUF2250 domain-containing protein [Desulforamulus aquiferis]RYD02674.1 hypothetical protein N752_23760 [Desulforamulus aquiferis]
MNLFNAKYHSDSDLLAIIKGIIQERDGVERDLAGLEVINDPTRMSELAKRLHELNQLCYPLERFMDCLKEIKDLGEILQEELTEAELGQFTGLLEGQSEICLEMAGQVYQFLLDKGYLDEEKEDDTDLEILKFIDYAGPEYAWRLGINIGIKVEEARRRLSLLLEKGYLERVEGNMLDNYHRAKDWTKHMNHTYYRITREGRLYLRRLRRESEA